MDNYYISTVIQGYLILQVFIISNCELRVQGLPMLVKLRVLMPISQAKRIIFSIYIIFHKECLF